MFKGRELQAEAIPEAGQVFGGGDHDYLPHHKKLIGGGNHDYLIHKKTLVGDDDDYFPNKKTLGGDDHDYVLHGLVGGGKPHGPRFGGDGHDLNPFTIKKLPPFKVFFYYLKVCYSSIKTHETILG